MERDHANAVLTRLHQAQNQLYSGGDDAAVREALTPDVVWHIPGDNAIAGDYRGIEEVAAYFLRRRDLAGSTFQLIPREILVGPADYAAARTDGVATLDGRQHAWSTLGLYLIRAERVAECWLLPLEPRSFDAIWARRDRGTRAPASVFHTRVRPRHCDAQGMLHASRYYEYFEDAFLDWLDTSIGGYAALRSAGTDLVVAASGCEHHHGAALDDQLAIEVRPTAAGRTSLSVAFTVRTGTGGALATGRATYVCVSAAGPVPLPDPLRAVTRNLPRRNVSWA
jgi:YbgC/YbaW family acyl-CoA thioester hydrolase